MTLIVSVATQEYVVQVSDRRLMDISNPVKPRVFNDDSNKNVFWNGEIAFGYSGLSKIGNEKTDEWLVSILAKSKLRKFDDILNLIKTKATEEFNKIHLPAKYLHHTFVGTGWVHTADGIHAMILEITNVPDEKEPLKTGKVEFKVFGHLLKRSEKFFIKETGQSSKIEMKKDFYHLLKKVVTRVQSAKPIVRCVVDFMRKVASINGMVGKELLVVVIPKKSLSGHIKFGGKRVRLLQAGSPKKDRATFLFIPEGSKNAIQYGPNIVAGGWGVRGVKATYHKRT